MKPIYIGIIILGLLIASPVPAKEGVTPMLKMHTTYHFILGSDFLPAAPFIERPADTVWALVWQGTVEGDIEGVIRWWVEFDPDPVHGGFGSLGRWEIWDCEPVYPSPDCDFDDQDQLILAGHDVFAYVSGSDWEGKGIVKYAGEGYEEWSGRRITDGGWVQYDPDPPHFPVYGEGPFVIYNTPSHKH